ncbi:flagellar filament capping protein FliD [Metabacillus arenae]|uniref:Flagellar filament capping protein FliD n=1 Tax=Metabacillus arenae TaxID=2771434 RepID=A0A926NH06_9BACI|nr:flagellar filament capping protein FliD [Metabacillus arenae]MBD1381399.1 flagellar filament capping protein FliD [Metabacillus arenae]
MQFTDDEREELNEKQIELWEEKAKSGLLKNDSLLTGGLNQLRLDIYSPVEGISQEAAMLSQIGIKTSSNYLDKGKLIFDGTKLREAIDKDPESIFQLFNPSGSTDETKGLTKRLRKTLQDTKNNIEQKAGNTGTLSTNDSFLIGRNLKDVDNQITRFEDRLIQIENRYWRQFTAMEKAIQRMNEQSMYLMQQFGGGM